MSDNFAFRFDGNGGLKNKNLAVFCSAEVRPDQITKVIKEDCDKNFLPGLVCLICSSSYRDEIKNLNENDTFLSEIENLLGIEKRVAFFEIDQHGEILVLPFGSKESDSVNPISIQQGGMLEIFRTRRGIITSSPNYHFVKPSGQHCDKFIRASNLLVSSPEVMFLASPLMSYITSSIKRIYVDTSSIAYLVLTAIQMKPPGLVSKISIHSFESYSGVNKNYDFVEDDSSLIVISATTSASLAEEIVNNTTFLYRQIVTLFHTGLPENQKGIFDISKALSTKIVSTSPEDCEFCKRGAKSISISGDQFLPETPKDELVVIRKPDFTKKRESFFNDFATRKVLHWSVNSAGTGPHKEHFYIDVKKELTCTNSKLKPALIRAFNKNVSQNMDVIVSVGGYGADALANEVKKLSSEKMTIYELSSLNESCVKTFKSVVVVSGAITSGRKLLSASRKLRALGSDSVICYIVGFSKLPTPEAFEQLRKDLEQGGHNLVILKHAPMPRIKEHTKTSWNYEAELLSKFDDPFMDTGILFPELLVQRSAELIRGSSIPLFLPTPAGVQLRLRKTFAFWSDLNLDTDKATQADVYWTIQSVIHDLRLKSEEKGLASTYHSTLISPVCFDRYNDGVIQACILRSAQPVELNYSGDEFFSRQMTDVICSALSSWDSDHGEGLLEFLLALACKRLQVLDKHLGEIIALGTAEMPDSITFFLDYISKLRMNT